LCSSWKDDDGLAEGLIFLGAVFFEIFNSCGSEEARLMMLMGLAGERLKMKMRRETKTRIKREKSGREKRTFTMFSVPVFPVVHFASPVF